MSARRSGVRRQQGFALLEAMIAVLIFALGILGIVAMGGTAIASQSDARVRGDAASLASEIASNISLSVPHNPDPNDVALNNLITARLQGYRHRDTGVTPCNYNGTDSGDPLVQAWVAKVIAGGITGLPGATAVSQQIKVDTANFNRLEVTVCWQTAADSAPRHHTLVTYID